MKILPKKRAKRLFEWYLSQARLIGGQGSHAKEYAICCAERAVIEVLAALGTSATKDIKLYWEDVINELKSM